MVVTSTCTHIVLFVLRSQVVTRSRVRARDSVEYGKCETFNHTLSLLDVVLLVFLGLQIPFGLPYFS